MTQAQDILRFWFETASPKQWFVKDQAFDAELKSRFLPVVKQALDGKLAHWGETCESNLALIILCDQMPRNIFRGMPSSFVGDGLALARSQAGVKRGDADTLAAQYKGQTLPVVAKEASGGDTTNPANKDSGDGTDKGADDDDNFVPDAAEARVSFLLMPMMHSEDLAIHDASLPLFQRYCNAMTYDYAVRHRDIIARFGRFPHRNAILGRRSTPEEIQFLTEPGSSF